MSKLSKFSFFNDPQNIIAVGVTVISLCALIVSLVQTNLLHEERELIREQSRASVWPYIELTIEKGHDLKDNALNHLAFKLSNNGVGPAIITDVKVTYKDSIVHNWWELFDMQQVPDSVKRHITNNSFNDLVIQSGKSIEVLNLDINLPLANAFFERLEGLSMAVYYKSIYGDVWCFDGNTTKVEGFEGLPDKDQFN